MRHYHGSIPALAGQPHSHQVRCPGRAHGSIPALAGQPVATTSPVTAMIAAGLSPRWRGNRRNASTIHQANDLVYPRAGGATPGHPSHEPAWTMAVYPRAGGATSKGQTPQDRTAPKRSIPALAGQPFSYIPEKWVSREEVYPRAGGATKVLNFALACYEHETVYPRAGGATLVLLRHDVPRINVRVYPRAGGATS